MTQQTQSAEFTEKASNSKRAGEYLLIATMIVFIVVALGVSTSFELAAVFSTCLGALITLAAAGARLLSQPDSRPEGHVQARLLQPTDETAVAKS